ncbi:hypothetical protein JHK82_043344 [Glycine max]|nr:hypothetical protein JHK82_043344 [Glycine max]
MDSNSSSPSPNNHASTTKSTVFFHPKLGSQPATSSRSRLAMASPVNSDPKVVTGTAGYILEDVPHFTDYIPNLPTYPNPLQDNPAYSVVKQYFVHVDDSVPQKVVVHKDGARGVHFRRAGPRQKVYFEADEVQAAIVTCGGLCPGLNTVIRELVCGLHHMYGVKRVLGINGGYRGFYARNTITLTPKSVNDIHKRGGTVLGTSRGGHDTKKIVDSIQDRGINQVYIIGGDGTQKGASAIFEVSIIYQTLGLGIQKRGLKVSVVGIPKTIDNDIQCCQVDGSRNSGFIAMYATLASRDVDCCLIPESPFYLEGPGGLYEYIEKRLKENGHMVIVIAEGAGQELVSESVQSMSKQDASGNKLFKMLAYGYPKRLGLDDPTYMIRAIPSNASDNVYCTLLAQSAVHGAMAGYTGYTSGLVNGRQTYIPFYNHERQNHVVITDRMWARLLSSTNQPSFLDSKGDNEEKKEEEAALNQLPDGHCSKDTSLANKEINSIYPTTC